MLNQIHPGSNTLLRRKLSYNKPVGTEVVDTSADNWMAPFAEHLGIVPPEFEAWRFLFGESGGRILLVEGDTDKEYIEHLRKKQKHIFSIPDDIEVVPYNGKGALQHPTMVQFVLSKMQKFLITFDLDAAQEAKNPLQRIGLKEGTDFLAIGISKPGREAIEGLLPDRILSAVNGRETDLVLQLTSQAAGPRRDARKALKKKYLEEFKKASSFSDAELEPLAKLARSIRKRFAAST